MWDSLEIVLLIFANPCDLRRQKKRKERRILVCPKGVRMRTTGEKRAMKKKTSRWSRDPTHPFAEKKISIVNNNIIFVMVFSGDFLFFVCKYPVSLNKASSLLNRRSYRVVGLTNHLRNLGWSSLRKASFTTWQSRNFQQPRSPVKNLESYTPRNF